MYCAPPGTPTQNSGWLLTLWELAGPLHLAYPNLYRFLLHRRAHSWRHSLSPLPALSLNKSYNPECDPFSPAPPKLALGFLRLSPVDLLVSAFVSYVCSRVIPVNNVSFSSKPSTGFSSHSTLRSKSSRGLHGPARACFRLCLTPLLTYLLHSGQLDPCCLFMYGTHSCLGMCLRCL